MRKLRAGVDCPLDDYNEYVRMDLRCLRNTFIGNFLDACAITLPVNPPASRRSA